MSHQKENYEVSEVRLNDLKGTLLTELMKRNEGCEFSIKAPEGVNIDKVEELDLDPEYEQYANHVNLDCLGSNDLDDANTSPFDVIASKMINLTQDGGVKKRVVKKGSGGVVPEKSVVFLHYNMYLELEEVPFDSSFLKSSKNCFKLHLGEGNVVPGFELAVASMAQGEKSQFLLQPDYAFREMGVPPRIPPSATILLEVDLVKYLCGTVDLSGDESTDYEDLKLFKSAYKKAMALHLNGNSHFESHNFNGAVDCYRKATNHLTSCSLSNDKEEADQKKLLLKLYRNLCICYNKLNLPQKVCLTAKEALFTDPVHCNFDAKLHFNWGKALINLSNFSEAGKHLTKAKILEPDNKAINAELVSLEQKRKEQLLHEKITYRRALGLNNSQPCKTANTNHLQDISKENEPLVVELQKFADSKRSQLELPSSLTREEKETAQRFAEKLGLGYKETKRMSGETVVAITKFHQE